MPGAGGRMKGPGLRGSGVGQAKGSLRKTLELGTRGRRGYEGAARQREGAEPEGDEPARLRTRGAQRRGRRRLPQLAARFCPGTGPTLRAPGNGLGHLARARRGSGTGARRAVRPWRRGSSARVGERGAVGGGRTTSRGSPSGLRRPGRAGGGGDGLQAAGTAGSPFPARGLAPPTDSRLRRRLERQSLGPGRWACRK